MVFVLNKKNEALITSSILQSLSYLPVLLLKSKTNDMAYYLKFMTNWIHVSPLVIINLICYLFSVRSVMHKYLEKKEEVNFDKIFNQVLGNINVYL